MYNKETNNKMPDLYYLVLWKDYSEEKSTEEPLATIMYF